MNDEELLGRLGNAFEALDDRQVVNHRVTRSCIISAALLVTGWLTNALLLLSPQAGWHFWTQIVAGCVLLPNHHRVTRWQREQDEKRARELAEDEDLEEPH